MEVTHDINLELGRVENPTRLAFMQKDSARTIHAKLYQNNIPWIPSGDFETYFAFNRPKKGPVVLTTVSRDDSIIPIVEVVEDGIIINITYEITAFAGEFPAVIGFVGSSGEQIATFPIFISVIENPAASSEDAEPIEPSQFDTLMSAIALERSRINNLATLKEGSTTGDAELQDIRVAEDSTVYGSAGEAVREQIAVVKNRIRPIENELKDARTGANDEEYDTIGEAIREQIKTVDSKVDEMLGEIVNARFGTDGTEYATLGDAIREQIQNISTGGGGGESSGIVNTASGHPIVLRDSADAPLKGLTIGGTDAESVTVKVMGKNLVDYRKAYVRNSAGQTVTVDESINGLYWTGNYYFVIPVSLPAGITVRFSCKIESIDPSQNTIFNRYVAYYTDGTTDYANYGEYITLTKDVNKIYVYKTVSGDETASNTARVTNIQLEIGKGVTEYEPYKGEQTLVVSVPDGLGADGFVCEDFAKLHTYKPNTTITNDVGAEMSVEYVADTKAYIDNKFTELQNAILASGANV